MVLRQIFQISCKSLLSRHRSDSGRGRLCNSKSSGWLTFASNIVEMAPDRVESGSANSCFGSEILESVKRSDGFRGGPMISASAGNRVFRSIGQFLTCAGSELRHENGSSSIDVNGPSPEPDGSNARWLAVLDLGRHRVAVVFGLHDKGQPVFDSELAVNVVQMNFCGAVADVQLLSNFLIRTILQWPEAQYHARAWSALRVALPTPLIRAPGLFLYGSLPCSSHSLAAIVHIREALVRNWPISVAGWPLHAHRGACPCMVLAIAFCPPGAKKRAYLQPQ